jgi:hypothetical protein
MKRTIEGDSSDQDDISGIRRREILEKWNEFVPIAQIARETGESVKTVYQTLSILQKARIERIGVQRHGKRKSQRTGSGSAT